MHHRSDACPEEFQTSNDLKVHEESHTNPQGVTLEYEECTECLLVSPDLNEHVCTGKREQIYKKSFKCSVCGKDFAKRSRLVRHEKIHLRAETGRVEILEKPYKCQACNKAFGTLKGLKHHEKMHAGAEQFVCGLCFQRFPNSYILQAHVLAHTEQPYKCDECMECFTSALNLENHKKTHNIPENDGNKKKPYVCAVCDKSFYSDADLKRHGSVHTGEKPHACDICSRTFAQYSNLTQHKKIHTEERPYKCDQCEKSFRSKWHLTEHERIHVGLLPFECNICRLHFRHRATWKRHQLLHTEQRPFKCSDCDKCFATLFLLNEHERIHSGEKPFSCEICGKGYRIRQSLRAHVRVFHNGKKKKKTSGQLVDPAFGEMKDGEASEEKFESFEFVLVSSELSSHGDGEMLSSSQD